MTATAACDGDSSPTSVKTPPEDTKAKLKMEIQNSGTDTNLYGVWALNKDIVWAVGGSVGTSGSGIIIKSTDGGNTWKTQHSGGMDAQLGVTALDQNRAWSVGFGSQIWYTADGGDTWTEQGPAVDTQYYKVVAFDEKTVWTVGAYGVLKLTNIDTDMKWEAVSIPKTGVFYGLSIPDENTIWITARDGLILRSTDAGESWDMPVAPIGDGWVIWDIAARDKDTAWLATGLTDNQGHIYGTTDGGKTWKALYSGEIPPYQKHPLGYFKAITIPRGWAMDTTPVFSIMWFLNPYALAFSPNGMKSSDWHPYGAPNPEEAMVLYGLSSLFYETHHNVYTTLCWAVGLLGGILRIEYQVDLSADDSGGETTNVDLITPAHSSLSPTFTVTPPGIRR